MIKTLRITSILAVVLAGALFIIPIVFGVRGDGQIEQFLNSAGVTAAFKEATGNKAKDSESELSPLVKQAEAFALYLNPPPKPKPVVQPAAITPEIRPPAPVSPKFTLVATVVNQSRPEESLAYIDEPGKGLHWVRQADDVSRLTIEQIKDGSVVVRDGQRTLEIATTSRPASPAINLLEGASSAAPSPIGNTASSPVSVEPSAGLASTSLPLQETEETPPSPEELKADAEGKAALDEFIAELAKMQKESNSDKNASADNNEQESTAAMEKMIEDLKATHVSAEEAKKLNGLGKELENIQRDSNLPASPASTKTGTPTTRTRRPIRPPIPQK